MGGCGKKVERPNVLRPDPVYVEAMRHTEKGDIAISLENKALIIATHLNPMDREKYRGRERFFIRVYIDNDFDDENRSGLFHPGFSLTLNGHPPTRIEKIDYDAPLAKKMPFTQKWYHLYLVTFPESQEEKLILTLSHPDYGSARLTFPNSPEE
ncbi:MAG: hypothetical protein C6I05_03440 [Epsilonproteobacteria bacterium]|nr:hypothetical protein [Campylobacterota bacterium]